MTRLRSIAIAAIVAIATIPSTGCTTSDLATRDEPDASRTAARRNDQADGEFVAIGAEWTQNDGGEIVAGSPMATVLTQELMMEWFLDYSSDDGAAVATIGGYDKSVDAVGTALSVRGFVRDEERREPLPLIIMTSGDESDGPVAIIVGLQTGSALISCYDCSDEHIDSLIDHLAVVDRLPSSK